jgi:hypothetical protein
MDSPSIEKYSDTANDCMCFVPVVKEWNFGGERNRCEFQAAFGKARIPISKETKHGCCVLHLWTKPSLLWNEVRMDPRHKITADVLVLIIITTTPPPKHRLAWPKTHQDEKCQSEYS